MSEYLFHANALGVGGAVTYGTTRKVIPSQAASVLSAGGGNGFARSENYDDNGVSFSSAETHVVGGETSFGIFQTIADVRITDFTVYDRDNFPRLRIGTMEARMTSTRNLALDESQFNVRLSYNGINIDGFDIEPMIDVELCSAPTFGDVADTLSSDLAGYASRFEIEPLKLSTALAAPAGAQSVTGALVKGFFPAGATALTSTGAKLLVPNVGSVHFAEFEYKPDNRRVRLLRLKLQSGVFELVAPANGAVLASTGGGDDGYVVAGAVEGNGSPPF